jgi:MFS family permease
MGTIPTSISKTPSPLRNPDYRRLWSANVFSGVGSAMHDTAAVWTMTSLTASPMLVTLMQSMSSLPIFLFALPAGALADIVDRRRLVLWAQAACLIVAAGLGLLALSGYLSVGLLLTVTFVLGIGNAITMPSWQALIPELVEKKQLPAAITLGGVGVNVARGLGPVMGGLLLAAAGAASVFLVNASTFVGLILALRFWKRPPQPVNANAERMLGAIVAAFRFTRHSALIHAVLIRNGWFVFCGIAPMALLPLVLRSRGADALEFGLQMGAYGAGGIVTAFLLLPALRKRFSLDALLLGATLVSALSIGLLSYVEHTVLTGMLMFTAGAAWLANLTTLNFAGQSAFPNWVRARSSAIQLLVVQGALALGALTWGQVTAFSSIPMALRIAAVGVLIGAVLIRTFPLNRVSELDLTPSSHWHEHEMAITPQPEDGPVLISIDYEIQPQNHEPFRVAMAKLRQIRLRDGAFRWSLFHDLADQTHFRESFLVGSWAEHLRQHDRATLEDKRIEEAVIAFHQGMNPPQVNHFLMTNVKEIRLPTMSDRERL